MGSQGASVPHIVAVPFIWPGHSTPLLHLCRYLASSGCLVTFLKVPDKIEARDQEESDQGVRIFSALPLEPARTLPAVQGPDEKQDFQEMERYFTEFESLHDKQLVLPIFEEISLNSGAPVTCIISDVYVGWAQQVAKRMDAEWIPFWTSTVSELVVYYHMPRLIREGVFPFSGPPSEKMVQLPGLPDLHPENYETMELIPPSALHSILHRFKEMVQRASEARRLLVNSIYELEKDQIESLRSSGVNVQAIGPLHLLSESFSRVSDPDGVLRWLDSKPASSVLYIAFGTTMPMAPWQFQELANALEESGQEFVWAIRRSVAEILPRGFEERMSEKNQGLLVYWAPQIPILKHPSVGGFFTHCGWNSVLEAISNGMPMIARPITGDQVLTRKMIVEEWGIALGLKGGVLMAEVAGKEEVKRVIRSLMAEEKGDNVRSEAKRVREMVKKATAQKGSSRTALVNLVTDLPAASFGKQ